MGLSAFSLGMVCLIAGSFASYLPWNEEDAALEEHIHRVIRSTEPDGYALATLHAGDDSSGLKRLTKRDVAAHASDPSSSPRQFALHLTSGERLRMSLRKLSVVSSATTVVENFAKGPVTSKLVPRNCYFAGPLESEQGHASLMMCDGFMMGSIHAGGRRYEVLNLPDSTTVRKRSADALRVLVTWTDSERAQREDESGGEKKVTRQKANEKDGLEIAEVDALGQEHIAGQHKILRRLAPERTITVELAHYFDSFFIDEMKQRYQLSTTADMLHVSILKWSGAAAILTNRDKLNWDITIKLVHVEVWHVNPDWYDKNTSSPRGTRMDLLCANTQHMTFDFATVSTTKVGDDALGVAYFNQMCYGRYRCSEVRMVDLAFLTELHEFGHCLGLMDGSCTATSGFMDGSMDGSHFRVEDCYTKQLDQRLLNQPSKACLYQDNYNASRSVYPQRANDARVDLLPLFSGQLLSFDSQCQDQYGPEYRYQHLDIDPCNRFVCMAVSDSNPNKGSIRIRPGVIGTPCGHDQICLVQWWSRRPCDYLNRTDVDLDKMRPLLTDGGWGNWSAFSPCVTVGSVAITIASRQCDSPAPRYGAYCQGPQHKAQLCPDRPKQTETNPQTVSSLANEVCRRMSTQWPASGFSGDGTVVKTDGDIESCMVQCAKSDGSKSEERFLLPDNAPCSNGNAADTSSRGVTYRCVHGKCMTFGCNGKTVEDGGGHVLDVCRVCGGNGTSCAPKT